MPLASNSFRFGSFQLDARAAELHTNGTKIKLGEQPFQVLCALLEHPGEVVTREELQQRLWPADTFVDFDHSLNAAVKRLREVLGDSAEHPVFIETLPRHGYRFIAAVDTPITRPAEASGSWKCFFRTLTPTWVFWGLLAFGMTGFVLWLVSERNATSRPPSGEPLPIALYPGEAGEPALSPDGDQVAFVAGQGSDAGIHTAVVGGEKSVRLTNNPGDRSPGWSPDGQQIAFYRVSNEGIGIYTIPALGGTEHRVYQGPPSTWDAAGLSWSPDGETIAFTEPGKNQIQSRIALFSLSDFSTYPLTNPDANHQDLLPSYSPDGSQILFERDNVSGTTANIFVIPVAGGNPRPITSDIRSKAGAAWTPDSKEIVFAAFWPSPGARSILWRVPFSGGTPVPIAGAFGAAAFAPSIARRGHRLVYQQTMIKQSIWRLDLKDEKHRRGTPTVLISEIGSKMRPHFSPDGKRIAFESDRLGYAEIWACDANGTNCAQLTSLRAVAGSPVWSPDGRYIAFEFHPHEQSEIYILEVASGQTRLLPTNQGWDNLAPGWSRDGQWLYFASRRGAAPFRFQLWKVPIDGGSPVQVTTKGGVQAFESIDRRFVYYTKYDVPGIWRMPVNGGQEAQVIGDFNSIGFRNWAVCENGIYFLSFKTHPQGTIQFFDFATGSLTPIWDLEKQAFWGLTLSPNGQSLLFLQVDFFESNIMLVENFH
jgi:Tol biopolymer transport system component/DNA-binding winged helix-turn-helix (wHTH) protein